MCNYKTMYIFISLSYRSEIIFNHFRFPIISWLKPGAFSENELGNAFLSIIVRFFIMPKTKYKIYPKNKNCLMIINKI